MLECQPKPDRKNFLYLISLTLTGPITEEQNTRGRLIYAPEDTRQTLGLLVDKPIPQVREGCVSTSQTHLYPYVYVSVFLPIAPFFSFVTSVFCSLILYLNIYYIDILPFYVSRRVFIKKKKNKENT